MPTDVITEATKPFLDGTIPNALVVLLAVIIVYRERYWQKRETELVQGYKSEINDERDKHDQTRLVLLEEVRKGGDALATFHQTASTLLKMARRDIT